MFLPACNWTRITADELVHQGPCTFFGIAFEVSADAGTIDIYDGFEDVSGRLFHAITMHGTGFNEAVFFPGVHFDKGIFIDVEANVTEVTVFWLPDVDDHPMQVVIAENIKYTG